jgi:hypothetical protein
MIFDQSSRFPSSISSSKSEANRSDHVGIGVGEDSEVRDYWKSNRPGLKIVDDYYVRPTPPSSSKPQHRSRVKLQNKESYSEITDSIEEGKDNKVHVKPRSLSPRSRRTIFDDESARDSPVST